VIERSEAEVTVFCEFGECDITFEGAVDERADRGRLEEDVGRVVGVQVRVAHRLHME
jgi:hypothetical protein